jgi:hypothetical protein
MMMLFFLSLSITYTVFQQAYTNELENKVSRLEEENEKLKKQKVLWFFNTIPSDVQLPISLFPLPSLSASE